MGVLLCGKGDQQDHHHYSHTSVPHTRSHILPAVTYTLNPTRPLHKNRKSSHHGSLGGGGVVLVFLSGSLSASRRPHDATCGEERGVAEGVRCRVCVAEGVIPTITQFLPSPNSYIKHFMQPYHGQNGVQPWAPTHMDSIHAQMHIRVDLGQWLCTLDGGGADDAGVSAEGDCKGPLLGGCCELSGNGEGA